MQDLSFWLNTFRSIVLRCASQDDLSAEMASIVYNNRCACLISDHFTKAAASTVLDAALPFERRLWLAGAFRDQAIAEAIENLEAEALCNVSSSLAYGEMLASRRWIFQAVNFYCNAINIGLNKPDLLRALAPIYWAHDMWEEAFPVYNELWLSLGSADFWAPIMAARCLFFLERHEETIAYLDALPIAYHADTNVIGLRQEALDRRDLFSTALQYQQEARQTDSASDESLMMRLLAEQKTDLATALGWLHFYACREGRQQPSFYIYSQMSAVWPPGGRRRWYEFFLREKAQVFSDLPLARLEYGRRLFSQGRFRDSANFLLPADVAVGRVSDFLAYSMSIINVDEAIAFDSRIEELITPQGAFFAFRRFNREELLAASKLSPPTKENFPATSCSSVNLKTNYGFSSRPKIALCVSGQLRGFRDAFPKMLAAWKKHCDVDVFVHTWKKIGGGGGANNDLRRLIPKEVFELSFRGYRTFDSFVSCFPKTTSVITQVQEMLLKKKSMQFSVR